LPGAPTFRQVFGGQLIGQALAAASKTVDCLKAVHSLHAIFLIAGDKNLPIIYQVHRARDGTSFATRKVEAKQKGLVIFTLIASFQVFILLVPSFVNNVQPQENFGILVLIKHLILSMASILGLFGSLPLLALPIFWQWQDLASQKNWWRWLF
jgi:hypothetical protein